MFKPRLKIRGSLRWAIFGSLLFLSVVPTVILTMLTTSESNRTLSARMEENLQVLAQARATEIESRLQSVVEQTQLAASQAAVALSTSIDPASVQTAMMRYEPDQRNILGLDIYYQRNGGEAGLGTDLSNVFWNYRYSSNSEQVAREIVQTESLDPLFRTIKQLSPETQWVYFTTPSGMMRLYPWASNDHYPDNWDPRQVIFYTVAEPSVNPDLSPEWTPPYVDFAGAGLMTTLSIPVIEPSTQTFMGIMSHDITISALQTIALDTHVLEGEGYGFLVDHEGNVIAHPDYYDTEDSRQGALVNTNLVSDGPATLRPIVQTMTEGQSGIATFTDTENNSQIIVYAPIESIGWSLGVVVPETAVLAPAEALRTRDLNMLLIFIALSIVLAWLLTRLLHRPLQLLLAGVDDLAQGRQVETIQVESFSELERLATAFNKMSEQVWRRETKLKETVAELRIEIDIQRQQREVETIVETDYFKQLEMNAERLRNRLRQTSSGVESSTEPSGI